MERIILILLVLVTVNAQAALHENTDHAIARQKRSPSSGLVDIAQFEDKSPVGKNHMVYVDDTMTRLIFQVTTYHEMPIIMPTTPAGIPYAKHPNIAADKSSADGKVVTTFNIPITSTADYGFWKFKKIANGTWHVVIRGESPVSFTYELFELGTNTPVSGYPVTGQSYKVVITTVGYTQVASCDMVYLFSLTKLSPIKGAPLVDKGNGKYEAAKVEMPSELFIVGLQGKDNSNHAFRRISTSQVVPVTLDLSVTPNTDSTVEEYHTFNISFVVTNLLKTTQEVDVRIKDSNNYTLAPISLSATLKIGENFTGNFVLKTSFAGMTSEVSIVARQYLGHASFSSGPEVKFNLTVVPKTTPSLIASTTAANKHTSSGAKASGSGVVTTPTTSAGISSGSGGSGAGTIAPSSTLVATGANTNNTAQSAYGSTAKKAGTTAANIIHDTATKQPNELDGTDDSGLLAVTTVAALGVAGVAVGGIIGAGTVGTAHVLIKKSKAKKVAAEKDKASDGKRRLSNQSDVIAWR